VDVFERYELWVNVPVAIFFSYGGLKQYGGHDRGRLKVIQGHVADLPNPTTCKSGGFEKQAQKNLEIRASNLETLKMCIK